MNWRRSLTTRLDVTPAGNEGTLAVSQDLVVAVYGLDLVEATTAIYVIHPVGVARVDTVATGASVHLVVAFAGMILSSPRLPLRRSTRGRAH
jgi:hypothetical protein